MALIPGVITEDAREYWPKFLGTLLGDPSTTTVPGATWNPMISHFKVGEGGWIDPGAGAVARTPVPDLRRLSSPLIQDLDAVVDTTRAAIDQRYPSDGRATFLKALTGSDFLFESPTIIRVSCLLDFGEFNDDGFGNSPEIWEIGLFSDHPTEVGAKLMIAYGTFPMQIKDNSKQLENLVRISF